MYPRTEVRGLTAPLHPNGAIKRICQLMGYEKILTYTLATENGSSLKALGAKPVSEVKPGDWSRAGRRRRSQKIYSETKLRWEL